MEKAIDVPITYELGPWDIEHIKEISTVDILKTRDASVINLSLLFGKKSYTACFSIRLKGKMWAGKQNYRTRIEQVHVSTRYFKDDKNVQVAEIWLTPVVKVRADKTYSPSQHDINFDIKCSIELYAWKSSPDKILFKYVQNRTTDKNCTTEKICVIEENFACCK